MDKSGPRHTALKSPIIQRVDLQSPQQGVIYGALTVAFWAFWFYLWLPVLALLAWSLGVQQAYKYMVVLGGYHDLIRLLVLYTLIILLLGGTLVVWALYNIIRFRGVEKRAFNLPITPAEIARDFGMDAEAVKQWQAAQTLCVTHNKDGRIARVDILAAGATLPA